MTTVLLVIAGPVGITLGWWLGKRSERDRTAREERKAAYVGFTTVAINYRNSDDEGRYRDRNKRWEALAVLTLVAPPAIVREAAGLAAAGDRLLEPDTDAEARRAVYEEVWQHITRFTALARADLGIGEADVFASLVPITGERITFERRAEPTHAEESR